MALPVVDDPGDRDGDAASEQHDGEGAANGIAIRALRAREMTGWFSNMASSGLLSCVDLMVLGVSPRMGRAGIVVWFQPSEGDGAGIWQH